MSTALRGHVSHTSAVSTNRIHGIGIPADDYQATLASARRSVTIVVPEAAGALSGDGIAILDIASGDVVVSALRVSVQGSTIVADNLSAVATVTEGFVTFTGEDFGADETLILTYIDISA